MLPGSEEFSEQLQVLSKVFLDSFGLNLGSIIEESTKIWFYNLKTQRITKLEPKSWAKLKESQTCIVSKELLCNSDEILEASFSVPVDEQLIEDSSSIKDLLGDRDNLPLSVVLSTPLYTKQEFAIPNLIYHRLSDLEDDFNETKILLKTFLKKGQAYLVDETDDEAKLTLFFKGNSNNLLEEGVQPFDDTKSVDSMKDTVKKFLYQAQVLFGSKQLIQYKGFLGLVIQPSGKVSDLLKYQESLNMEMRGDFEISHIQNKLQMDRKHGGYSFLAFNKDSNSIGQVYYTKRKDMLREIGGMNSNLNMINAEYSPLIDFQLQAGRKSVVALN